jgi:hypothetical protein
MVIVDNTQRQSRLLQTVVPPIVFVCVRYIAPMTQRLLFIILLFVGALSSCTSVYDATNKSPEEIFAKAMSEYRSNDLFEAQRLFDIIRFAIPYQLVGG